MFAFESVIDFFFVVDILVNFRTRILLEHAALDYEQSQHQYKLNQPFSPFSPLLADTTRASSAKRPSLKRRGSINALLAYENDVETSQIDAHLVYITGTTQLLLLVSLQCCIVTRCCLQTQC